MTQSYSEVLKGLFFSVHSRRFLAAVVSAHLLYLGSRAGLGAELLGVIVAPIVAFIAGESYRDGKAVEGQPIAAGGDVTVNRNPEEQSSKEIVKDNAEQMARDLLAKYVAKMATGATVAKSATVEDDLFAPSDVTLSAEEAELIQERAVRESEDANN